MTAITAAKTASPMRRLAPAGLAAFRSGDMLTRRSASASGLDAGLGTAASGLTLWGVLILGVAVTGAGSLGRVPLAVMTLTALAAFEAVTALSGGAYQPLWEASP